MKKSVSLLLVVLMLLSLTACSAEALINDALSSVKNDIEGKIDDTLNGIGQDILNNFTDATGNAIDDASQNVADGIVGSTVGHTPDYWAEKYGTNRCPFSINTLGISLDYHFRDGGNFDFWVYTEENVSGWYINDGYIISADNAFGIKIEGLDSFSSCCEYNAVAFAGNGLSEEERKAQKTGVFYVLNSYTPVRTNWGVQLYSQSDIPEEINLTVYNLKDTFYEQEWFRFYIAKIYDEYTSKAKLWAFEHRDRSEYDEILTNDFLEKGVSLGTFEYDSNEGETYVDAYIPDKDAGGFAPGMVDIVMTYGEENVTVGVITVNVVPSEK